MNTENIIPVNNEALSRALIAVVGEERAAVIVQSYREIDRAMADGYAAGVKSTEEASQNRADDAFERGCKQGDEDKWEAGYQKGYDDGYGSGYDASPDYDDGYVDGVSDARVCPSDADARVAELCAYDDFEDEWPELQEDDFACDYIPPTDFYDPMRSSF